MKEVCGVAAWVVPENNASKRILNSLQLSKIEFGVVIENRVDIVGAGLHKGNCDCSGSVISEGVVDVAKSTDMVEGRLAN